MVFDNRRKPVKAPSFPFAKGKYARAISDRSGLEYPYREMVREWNGLLVHISEYEPKHPQLDPIVFNDPEALKNARPQAPLSATGGVPNQISVTFPGTFGDTGKNVAVATGNSIGLELGNVSVVIS